MRSWHTTTNAIRGLGRQAAWVRSGQRQRWNRATPTPATAHASSTRVTSDGVLKKWISRWRPNLQTLFRKAYFQIPSRRETHYNMQPTAFAFSTPVLTHPSLRKSCIARRTRRTPAHTTRPRQRVGPYMLAQFQEKNDAEKPVQDASLAEGIVPPVQLPTLSTLSDGVVDSTVSEPGAGDASSEVDLSLLSAAEEESLSELQRAGVSLSREEEFNLIQFFREVYDISKSIDWPEPGRVFKILIIVILSIVVSAGGTYLVDGFFYEISQKIFYDVAPM